MQDVENAYRQFYPVYPEITSDETLTVESGHSVLDYIDLGLKALLVIAAFAIYARL